MFTRRQLLQASPLALFSLFRARREEEKSAHTTLTITGDSHERLARSFREGGKLVSITAHFDMPTDPGYISHSSTFASGDDIKA